METSRCNVSGGLHEYSEAGLPGKVDICGSCFYSRGMSRIDSLRLSPLFLAVLCWCTTGLAYAQAGFPADYGNALQGHWQLNETLSQNTDDQVEAAIKAAGGKVERRWFRSRPQDYYRGGPEEQEMYDRISYDRVLTIRYAAPEFQLEYADGFTRVLYTDGRSRSTGVNDYFRQGGADFSFGSWDGEHLFIEGRPRDGGYTEEIYSLEENGQRLRVELEIKPQNFAAAISLVRVYDRQP